jgi:hypothetical protein
MNQKAFFNTLLIITFAALLCSCSGPAASKPGAGLEGPSRQPVKVKSLKIELKLSLRADEGGGFTQKEFDEYGKTLTRILIRAGFLAPGAQADRKTILAMNMNGSGLDSGQPKVEGEAFVLNDSRQDLQFPIKGEQPATSGDETFFSAIAWSNLYQDLGKYIKAKYGDEAFAGFCLGLFTEYGWSGCNDFARTELASSGEAAEKVLLKALVNTGEPTVQEISAYVLGEMPSGAAVKPLTSVLRADTSNDKLKLRAIQALGKIADSGATDVLITYLNYPNDKVVVSAIGALGNIKDAKALKALKEAAKNHDLEVSAAAKAALSGQ